MRIVSVDPAPKKDAVLFDGKLRRCPAGQLASYCQKLSEEESVLLCWDAPLTGPPNPDDLIATESAYTQRVIEKFFARRDTGYKALRGISVLPYSGCPHWTITRASLGLPRVGRFDLPNQDLPFQLVHEHSDIKETGKWVVETHPAVAIWLWCRQARANPDLSWIYKGAGKNSALIAELWFILIPLWKATGVTQIIEIIDAISTPETDDELDAIVGWVLGVLTVHHHNSVAIVGDAATGSFVLPADATLLKAFEKFRSTEIK